MAKKPKFLKNLLTTASAVAVIASAGNAMAGGTVAPTAAAARQVTANNANLNTGANLEQNNPGGGAVDAALVSGSTLRLGGNFNITHNKAVADFNIAAVDTNNYTSLMTISGANVTRTLGPVIGTGTLNITLDNAAAHNLTLSGTAVNPALLPVTGSTLGSNPGFIANQGDYAALGNLVLDNANDVITFGYDGTFLGEIDAGANAGAGNGSVVIKAGKEVVFGDGNANKGSIGRTLEIKTFTLESGTAADPTKATFNKEVEIDNAGATAIRIGDNATANIAAGVNLTGANQTEIIDAANAANGTLNFVGASVVKMDIGNNRSLLNTIIGNGKVTFNGAGTLASDNIKLNNDNARAVLKGNAGDYTVTGNFITDQNGRGTIELDTNGAKIEGSIGAADMKINTVALVQKALSFEIDKGGLHSNSVTTTADTKGSVTVKANEFTVNSVLGTNNLRLQSFVVQENLAGGGAATVTLAEGAKIWLENGANGFDISPVGGINNIVRFSDDSVINGEIDPTTANEGIFQVKGNGTIMGNFANAVKEISFDTDGKTLTIGGANIQTKDGLNFTQNGTLSVVVAAGGAADTDVAGPVVVGVNAEGLGTISHNVTGKTLKFAGEIGDVTVDNKSLGKLQFVAGDIQIGNNASIHNVDFGQTDDTLKLVNNGKTVFVAGTTNQAGRGKVTIEVAGVELKANSKFGSEDAKLKTLTFVGDRTLTIQDNVELHFTGIQADGEPRGTLIFKDRAIVNSSIGYDNDNLANSLKAIELDSAAGGTKRKVEFRGKINVGTANTSLITIGNDRIAEFQDDVTALSIRGKGANDKGTALFNNANDATITSSIGDKNALAAVQFAGNGNITVNNDVIAPTIGFLGTQDRTVTFKNTSGGIKTSKFTSESTLMNHNIILGEKVNVTLNGQFGEEDKQFGDVTIQANGNAGTTLTITNPLFFASAKTDNTANKLDLNATSAGRIRGIGSKTLPFDTTTFNQSTTVHGDAWSNTFEVAAAKTATFKGIVGGSTSLNLNNTSIAKFEDGSDLLIPVNGVAASNGRVEFTGNRTLNVDLGTGTKLGEVQFTGTNNVTLSKRITADNIKFSSQTVTAPGATLTGATLLNGTTLNLGTGMVTLADGVSSATGAAIFNTTLSDDRTGIGHVEVSGGTAQINLSNVSKDARIIVNDTQDLAGVASKSYKLFDFQNSAVLGNSQKFAQAIVDNPDFIDDRSTNGFVNWTFDRDTFSLVRNEVAQEKFNSIKEIADDSDLKRGSEVITANLPLLNDVRKISDDKRIVELVDRLANTVALPRVADDVMHGLGNAVSNRIADIPAGIQTSSAESGVSAGDNMHHMHGIWAMPFLSHSEQDKKSGTSGYKADSYGMTLGADTQVNADMLLGAAFGYAHSNIKHKDSKSGDKTDGDTFMFSVYGTQQITNEWFAQGVATFGSTRFKNKEKRLTSTGSQTASGKFDSSTYGVELLGGYTVKVEDITILPMAGAAYTRINNSGYTETGTTNQNLTVKQKSTNKLEVIAGAKVDFGRHDMQDLVVKPEMHGFVRHDLLNKEAKIDTKLGSQSFNQQKAEISRTFFDLGVGVMAESGDYEFGIAYDATLASKFVGHQGTLKVRLNF